MKDREGVLFFFFLLNKYSFKKIKNNQCPRRKIGKGHKQGVHRREKSAVSYQHMKEA